MKKKEALRYIAQCKTLSQLAVERNELKADLKEAIRDKDKELIVAIQRKLHVIKVAIKLFNRGLNTLQGHISFKQYATINELNTHPKIPTAQQIIGVYDKLLKTGKIKV